MKKIITTSIFVTISFMSWSQNKEIFKNDGKHIYLHYQLGIYSNPYHVDHGLIRPGAQINYDVENWMFDLIVDIEDVKPEVYVDKSWSLGLSYYLLSENYFFGMFAFQYDFYQISTFQKPEIGNNHLDYSLSSFNNRLGFELGTGWIDKLGLGLKLGFGYRWSSYEGALDFYKDGHLYQTREAATPEQRGSIFGTYGVMLPFTFKYGILELNYTRNYLLPQMDSFDICYGCNTVDTPVPAIKFHLLSFKLALDLGLFLSK